VGEGRQENLNPVRTWGSTALERAQPFPCDDAVADPDTVLFRAIDVDSPPEHTFRWLCQLRVAPYSYDWIDNLGRRSPRTLTPGLDALVVGQRFMTIFILVAFVPGRELTIRTDGRLFGKIAVTYRVVPRGVEGSRIIVKVVARSRPGALGSVMRVLLTTGDLVMMRKQLRTLAALAERSR
jgi:hypothetical protein